MLKKIWDSFKELGDNFVQLIKWIIIAILIGGIVGGISTVFAFVMEHVTAFRTANPWMVYTLPVGGLIIAALYKYLTPKDAKKRGTNLVLASIHSNERLPKRMAPLIFISTVISHLCGASVGREGAALQLGGSLGALLGKVIKLDESDRKVLVLCGMSAAFAALFGTPMAAAVFALEVVNVGVIYYAALVPCIFSALIASQFAADMGIHPEEFHITDIPGFNITSIGQCILIAIIVSVVSVIFCLMLHAVSEYFQRFFKNEFIRVIVGSAMIILLTLLLGTNDYLGAGIPVIDLATAGTVLPMAFLLKMIYTSISIGCGFKGGEIVPSFFVGATLGCLMGQLIGFSPSTAAAVGMVGMFCCVTNCPITSTLIAFELFGYKAVPFFLICNSVGYLMSGYCGLYSDQLMAGSKYKLEIGLSKHKS